MPREIDECGRRRRVDNDALTGLRDEETNTEEEGAMREGVMRRGE